MQEKLSRLLGVLKAHCKPFNVRKCVKACNRRKRFIVANGFFLDGAMSIGSHRSSHMWLRDGVTPPGWPFEAMKGPDTTRHSETLGIKVKTQANVSGRLIQVSERNAVGVGEKVKSKQSFMLAGNSGFLQVTLWGPPVEGPQKFFSPLGDFPFYVVFMGQGAIF